MSEQPTDQRPHHFNPVTVMVDNTIGAILLGILALALLVALLRSQAQIRRLQQRAVT